MPAAVEHLTTSPFNSESAKSAGAELSRLSSAAVVRRLTPGETLVAEGENARYCYQILSGVVKEYNTLEDGVRQITDFYGAGEYVGFAGAAEQRQTVEAVTECSVRCISRDALARAVATSTQMSGALIDLLLNRLDRAQERIIAIARKTAGQRVAAFLVRMLEEQGRSDFAALPMSRQDIADHLGLTIETVCRSFTDFKEEGVISMPTFRRIVIEDLSALFAAAGERAH